MSALVGFPGQRYRVLPGPVVAAAAREPLTRSLRVTHAGYFPIAVGHRWTRPRGAPEAVILFCAAGSGTVALGGDRQRVAPGDAVVLPRGVTHAYYADTEDPWTLWWMHVAGPTADELVDVIVTAAGPIVRVADRYRLVGLLDACLTALERDETRPSRYEAAGAAGHALAEIAASATTEVRAQTDGIERARAYLREHLDTRLSVPALARLAGLSPSHFAARFRAATGVSVTAYVKALRSARARELLATTDATVAEIGRAVGYPDALYFSRQFRAITGVSPTAFRASARP